MKVSARLQHKILASAMIVSMAIAGLVFCGTATVAAPVQQNHQTTSPQHWLEQAREMLGEGRVELAEQYVQLAETLLQRQPGLKLDYTPEMARQRIAEMRSGGQPQVLRSFRKPSLRLHLHLRRLHQLHRRSQPLLLKLTPLHCSRTLRLPRNRCSRLAKRSLWAT